MTTTSKIKMKGEYLLNYTKDQIPNIKNRGEFNKNEEVSDDQENIMRICKNASSKNLSKINYMEEGLTMNNIISEKLAPKMTQILTAEQIENMKNPCHIDTKISESERLQAICTHKENGKIALVENSDGTVTCPICGARFHMLGKCSDELINKTVSSVIEIMENVKTIYLDISEEEIQFYSQCIPILKRIPLLYSIAEENYRKYDKLF